MVNYIVMIDPGYGGIDSGEVGAEALKRSTLVLATTNTNLRTLLQNHPEVKVRLTRESDHFIPF